MKHSKFSHLILFSFGVIYALFNLPLAAQRPIFQLDIPQHTRNNQKIVKWYKLDTVGEQELLPYQPAHALYKEGAPTHDTDAQEVTDCSLHFEATDFETAYVQRHVQNKKQPARSYKPRTIALVETVNLVITNHYDNRDDTFTSTYTSNTASYLNLPPEIFSLLETVKKTQKSNDALNAIEQWALDLINRYRRVQKLVIDLQLQPDEVFSHPIAVNTTITVHNDVTENYTPQHRLMTAQVTRQALIDKGTFVGHHLTCTFSTKPPENPPQPATPSRKTSSKQPADYSYEGLCKRLNERGNQDFLRLLAYDPTLVSALNYILCNIEGLFYVAFDDGARLPCLRMQAHRELLALKWPDELPKNNQFYEQFCLFKKELASCEANIDSHVGLTKYQRRTQAFKNFFKNTLNEDLYHQLMRNSIKAKVPHAQKIYDEDLKQAAHDAQAKITHKTDNAGQSDYTQAAETLQSKQRLINPHHVTKESFLWKHFFLYFNEYGIDRSWERDHHWRKYPAQKLNFFRAQLALDVENYCKLTELHELNWSALAPRWEIKEDLAESIGAPTRNNGPAYIDELLYKIVDHCQQQTNIPGIFQELAHLSADSTNAQYRQLYQQFFDTNGICKLIGLPEQKKILLYNTYVDSRINLAANTETRALLNYFAALPLEKPEKNAWIRTGMDYCWQACQPGEIGQAYQQLATVQFNAYINQANNLILKCGNFAERLKTPVQQEVQTKIVLRVANLVSSSAYAEEEISCTLKIAVLEAARQLNSEDKSEAALQALTILDQYATYEAMPTEHDGDDKKPSQASAQITQHHEIMQAGSYERTRVYEIPDVVSESMPAHTQAFDLKRGAIIDPALDARVRAFMKRTQILEDATQFVQQLHEVGAHETAEVFLNAVMKIARCVGNFGYGMYEYSPLRVALHPLEALQGLSSVVQLIYYLAPAILELTVQELFVLQAFAKINSVCAHFGILEQARSHPATAWLICASDMAQLVQQNVLPSAFERSRTILSALVQNVQKGVTEFVENASAEQWSKVAGNVTALFHMPAFLRPQKILETINEMTGAGKAIAPYLADIGEYIARSANSEELIKDLERFGLEETYIEEILNHVEKAAERIGFTGAGSLETSVIAEKLCKLTAQGKSTTDYLKAIGYKVGRYGLQGDKFATRLEYAGLNESQIVTIMSETYRTARTIEGALIRDTPPFNKLRDLAEELGKFCTKKIRAGKSVDLKIYKEVIGNIEILEQGINELSAEGCIGKNGPASKILTESLKPSSNTSNIKGAIYEIERGLKFKKQGKKIDLMSYHILDDLAIKKRYPENVLNELRAKYGNVEYDIKIGDTVIECKDINWNNLNDLEGFIKQRDLAQYFGMKYEVYSKQKIPQRLQQKLIDAGIVFFEE